MGNTVDKDGDSWISEDYNADTIARDITYKSYGKSEKRSTPERSRSINKDSSGSSGRKKSVMRSNSTRRRSSFKAKRNNSIKTKNLFRSTSRERKAAGSAFLLSDMEVKVEGKKAKLVPRKSVLVKRGNTVANKTELKTKSPKSAKGTKNRPKDSVKVASQQLQAKNNLCKRPSYEAAITSEGDNSKSQKSLQENSKPNILPKHLIEKMSSQNKRWSNVDFSPRNKKESPQKHRPTSYINVNNNNIKSSHSEHAMWRLGDSYDQSKRRSSGHEIYKELSGEMSKLALVSPITDV